jgi:hypothetical protein
MEVMDNMAYPKDRLFDSPQDFFELKGSVGMRLTPEAAKKVCEQALGHDLLVVRVEGGIWHNPGFEVRLDSLWDGPIPPVPEAEAQIINLRAAEFICEEQQRGHDVFLVTTMPMVQQ